MPEYRSYKTMQKGWHIPTVERCHPARVPRPQEPTSGEAQAILAGTSGTIHRG